MKSSPIIRLIVLLLILVGVHAGYAFVRSGTPHEVRPPKCDVDALPMQLGDWQCRNETPRDNGLDDPAGADQSISRIYASSKNQVVASAYVAIWSDYNGQYLPHEPTECYPASGFVIQDMEEVQLKHPNGPSAPARLMHAERNGQSTYVLYWYQLDQQTMYTISAMRELRWKYVGEGSWPPLVKVMLDVRGTTAENAKRLLVDFGEQILGWTSTSL